MVAAGLLRCSNPHLMTAKAGLGIAASQLSEPNQAPLPSPKGGPTSKRVMVNSEARRSQVPSSSVELHEQPDRHVTFAVPMRS